MCKFTHLYLRVYNLTVGRFSHLLPNQVYPHKFKTLHMSILDNITQHWIYNSYTLAKLIMPEI